MNFIVLAFWVLTVLSLGISVIVGLARGFNRALLRLVLVLICAVLAFALRGVVTDAILDMDVSAVVQQDGEATPSEDVATDAETVTLRDMILENFPEQFASLGNIAIELAKVLVYAIIFVVLFWLFKFLSWLIIFPICKIFIKHAEKKEMGGSLRGVKNSERTGIAKKRKGLGALVGLAQGVVIAICLLMPFGAMMYQVDHVMIAISDMQSSSEPQVAQFYAEDFYDGESDGGSDSFLSPEIQAMLDGYADSVIGKFYGEVCRSSFDSIASVKTEQGKITFSDLVTVASEAPKLMDSLEDIMSSMDGLDYTDPKSLDKLKEAMKKLDEFNASLPASAKETMNTVISEVVKGLAEGFQNDSNASSENKVIGALFGAIDKTLEDVKFTDIKFAEEIGVIQDVVAEVNEIFNTEVIDRENVEAILESMGQSKLIVPIIENLDMDDLGIEAMDEETKAKFGEQLDELATTESSQRVADALKTLLGIE